MSTSASSSTAATSATPLPKGFGSFQSPSVEVLIHQSDTEYVTPELPEWTKQFDLPKELLLENEKSEKKDALTSSTLQSTPPLFGRHLLPLLFHIDPSWTFINHGAFGGALKSLLQIRNQWSIEMEKQPLRFIDRAVLPLLVETTRRVAKFVGAPPTSITLHTNVTTALNILFHNNSLALPPKAKVLRLNLCYGAVKKMLDAMHKRGEVEVTELQVSLPLKSRKVLIDLVQAELEKSSYALAVFDSVASNSGISLPIDDLIRICHSTKTKVLIDGAHSLGSIDVALEKSGVDYYVANAHKWLCNPKGAALMYVAPAHQSTITPLIISHGTGSGFISDFVWTGCQDYATLLTLMSTIQLWEKVGLDRVRQRNHRLVLEAGQMLAKRWKTELLVGDGNVDEISETSEASLLSANMLCIRLPGPITPSDDEHNQIQNELHFKYNIEVPIKVLNNSLWVRISAMIYNEMSDYERLAEVMMEIRGGETMQEKSQTTNSTSASASTSTATSSTAATTTTTTTSTSSSSSSFFPPTPPQLTVDHAQVCIPVGLEAEQRARRFYVDLLGMKVMKKPLEMNQTGVWLYAGCDDVTDGKKLHANVHLGVEENFNPAHYSRSKAHIAYRVKNLTALIDRLRKEAADLIDLTRIERTQIVKELKIKERYDVRDPFGNRVELIEYEEDTAVSSAMTAASSSSTSCSSSCATTTSTTSEAQEYFWHRPSFRTPESKGKSLLRLGVYQGASANGEIRENLNTIQSVLKDAKGKGIELVLFNELFLTGYALDRETMHRLAIKQDSKFMNEVREMCQECGVGICLGYPEEEVIEEAKTHGHTTSFSSSTAPPHDHSATCSSCQPLITRHVYNSAILINSCGEIILNYRKTHLWMTVEKSMFMEGSETQLRVVEYKQDVRIGINICYDVEFGECSRLLSLRGANLILVPTALAIGEVHEIVPLKVVPVRALDNHVWIGYSNHVGPSYKDKEFCGLSGIIGPDGCDLARAGEKSTVLLQHDLIPSDYAAKFDTTPLLIDRRAELFHELAKQTEWK